MDRIRLGRTGLDVSVAGLGCGGHSRLGQRAGASEQHSVDIVRAALDLGINFIDTAIAYRTETIVGKAIRGRRDEVVISTKIPLLGRQGGEVTGASLKAATEDSLRRLGTDYIDILHLHGLTVDTYAQARDELVPALDDLAAAGKIGFKGVTELFVTDTSHEMLDLALDDDLFDVVMVGFNMLNPSARHKVFERTRANNVGTLIMFAVRRALSQPDALVELVAGLIQSGEVDAGSIDPSAPLDFLLEEADSIIAAAYRYCRHEPGTNVVLTGTGVHAHLVENVASIGGAPLSEQALTNLRDAFGGVSSVSAN